MSSHHTVSLRPPGLARAEPVPEQPRLLRLGRCFSVLDPRPLMNKAKLLK